MKIPVAPGERPQKPSPWGTPSVWTFSFSLAEKTNWCSDTDESTGQLKPLSPPREEGREGEGKRGGEPAWVRAVRVEQ